jgi:nicotinic acid mononucleotide adenylyltransferase
MNTLAEQFANDWLLVIENDQDSWNQLVDDVKSMGCDPIATTAYLREEWDVLVDQMASAVEDKVSDIGALLLRQMLLTGDYAHQLIANHVISSIEETNKYQPEVNDLVKSKEESNA